VHIRTTIEGRPVQKDVQMTVKHAQNTVYVLVWCVLQMKCRRNEPVVILFQMRALRAFPSGTSDLEHVYLKT